VRGSDACLRTGGGGGGGVQEDRPTCLPAWGSKSDEREGWILIHVQGTYLGGWLHVSHLESSLQKAEEEVAGVLGKEGMGRDLVVVCENWTAVGEGWVSCGTSRTNWAGAVVVSWW
jgi:hypothetical protein